MSYYSFVLDENERSKLLSLYPPKFSKVIANHVTMCMKQNVAAFDKYLDEFYDGVIIGMVTDGRSIEAMIVDMNFNGKISHQCDGRRLHCTWSLDPDEEWEETGKKVKPVNSNDLIKLYDAVKIGPIKFKNARFNFGNRG